MQAALAALRCLQDSLISAVENLSLRMRGLTDNKIINFTLSSHWWDLFSVKCAFDFSMGMAVDTVSLILNGAALMIVMWIVMWKKVSGKV